MKSLYESILNKAGVGIKIRIDEWCQEHMIYDGHYIVNNDNTISPTDHKVLHLFFDNYTKLPPYIKFKGGDDIDMVVGGIKAKCFDPPKIDSFSGLPDHVRNCSIVCGNESIIDLKIRCGEAMRIAARNLKRFVKSDITADTIHFTDDDLKGGFTGLKTHNVKSVIMTNDFNLGDTFSSMMSRKAEMNKYKGKFDIPVKDEALVVIKTFFEPWFDIDALENIEYTQNSKLVKHKGKWYRCKNW